MDPCVTCLEGFHSGDNLGIACHGPAHAKEKWFHRKCVDLPLDRKASTVLSKKSIFFFCDECMPLLQGFLSSSSAVPPSPVPLGLPRAPASHQSCAASIPPPDTPQRPQTPCCDADQPIPDPAVKASLGLTPTLLRLAPPADADMMAATTKPTSSPLPGVPVKNRFEALGLSPSTLRIQPGTAASSDTKTTTTKANAQLTNTQQPSNTQQGIQNTHTKEPCLYSSKGYPHEVNRKERILNKFQYLSSSHKTLFIGASHLNDIKTGKTTQVLNAGGLCIPALTDALSTASFPPHNNFVDVYICLGTNDILHGRQAQHPLHTLKSWLQQLQSQLKKYFPKARLHFVTPFQSPSTPMHIIQKFHSVVQYSKLFTVHRSPEFTYNQFKDQVHLTPEGTTMYRAFLDTLRQKSNQRHMPQIHQHHIQRQDNAVPPLMSVQTGFPEYPQIAPGTQTYASIVTHHNNIPAAQVLAQKLSQYIRSDRTLQEALLSCI